MDIKQMLEHVQEEDFIIRVRPSANKDGEWNGEIDLSIMAMPDNPLTDDDYWQIMHFCKMLCATVPVMEEVEEMRDLVHNYVVDVIDNDLDIEVQLEDDTKDVQKTYDGNIVRLDFNTKTGGSA